MPAVTVITPTRNRRELLCKAIESVQAQLFSDWEHIVVDDGSNDGTAEEVGRRSCADGRLRLLGRPADRAGANVCRNVGLRESRGDLVVFLDSDDLLRPECLMRRVDVMRRNEDLDFAVFPAGVFRHTVGDTAGPYHPMHPGDDLLRFLSHECVWEISGPIWRRAFLQRLGGFNEQLSSMQDAEMHVRALTARGKYLFFGEPDHDIRGHDDPLRTSTRHYREPSSIRASEFVRQSYYDHVRRAGLLTWSRQRALLGLSFAAGELWVDAGQLIEGWRTWSRACRSLQVSAWLRLEGGAMIVLAKSLPKHIAGRVLSRWKAWRRLRPEPIPANLLDVKSE